MCVYVCVCCWVNVYVYLCMYVYFYVYIFVYVLYVYVFLCSYVYVYAYIFCVGMRVWFVSWVEWSSMTRETGLQSQVESYQRLKKWHLIHYKACIKGKVEQSRERSSALHYTSV